MKAFRTLLLVPFWCNYECFGSFCNFSLMMMFVPEMHVYVMVGYYIIVFIATSDYPKTGYYGHPVHIDGNPEQSSIIDLCTS